MTAFLRRAFSVTLLAVCMLALSPNLAAQEYKFQYFGVDQGLSNLLVQSIYQDRTGFLWVSTQEGVFRYDGDRFHRFGKSDGLPLMSGAAFAEAADGTLLVGGTAGLFQLNAGRFEKIPLAGDPQVTWLHGMQSDVRGHTFIGTSAGLMVLSGELGNFSIHLVPRQPGVDGNGAWGIFLDGGGVWYGCGQQLCQLLGNDVRVFGRAAGLSPAVWIPIGKDLQGNLWVQGRGAGIRVLARGATVFRKAAGPLPVSGFTGLPATDGEGYVVFPSPDGLSIRRQNDWWTVGRQSGLLGTAYSVFRDRQGSLWIGLEGQGLVRWAGYRQWEAYTPNSGFNSDVVYQILTPPDGSVWAATVAGLFRGVSNGRTVAWHKIESVGRTPVVSLAFDPEGKLWVGSEQSGLARLNPATGALQRVGKAEVPAVSITALAFDHQQRLWAATDAGVYTADPPYSRFHRVDALPRSGFWTLAMGKNGGLWAGGESGLYHLAGNSWHRFTTADGLSHQQVVALGAAPDGAIWAGYQFGAEIDRIALDNGHFRIGHDTRLAHRNAGTVYFFGFDGSGRMWAGTDRGVDVLDNGRWIHMDTKGGLVWDDCDENGFAAAPDGSIWIGTSNGLAHFTPSARFGAIAPFNVVFNRLALGVKDVTGSAQQPSVDYLANSFVAQYSSLDFVDGDALTYRYRLLPLFSEWRTTDRNELEFPGLPPGDYMLEVAVQDPWSQIQAPAARFAFEIRTPWFRSWWFAVIVLVMAVCLVALIVTLRTATLRDREVELVRQVEARTAELKRANKELFRLSSIDSLTGVANRRVCDETLRREWARMSRSGAPLSAMMLDADEFKRLNDIEGHQRGDEYLVRLAGELRARVKRETDLAARYGGEEFVLVLPGTDGADAERFAESLRVSIESLCLPHLSSTVAPVLTVSIGVGTALPDSFTDVAAFMAAIDHALYTAKARGRNRVVSIFDLPIHEKWSDSIPQPSTTGRPS